MPNFCKRSRGYLNILKYPKPALLCILYEGKKGQEQAWEPWETPKHVRRGQFSKGHLSGCLCASPPTQQNPLPPLALQWQSWVPLFPSQFSVPGAMARNQHCHPNSHPGHSRPGKAVVLRLVGGWQTKNDFPAASPPSCSSRLPPDLLWALCMDQAFIGQQPQQSSIGQGADGLSSSYIHRYQALGKGPLIYLSFSNTDTVQDASVLLKVTAYFPLGDISTVRVGSYWNVSLTQIQLQFCCINMFLPTTQEVPVSSRGFWLPLGVSGSQVWPGICPLCSASVLGTLADNR